MIEAFYLLRMDGKSVQSRQVMLTGGEAAGLMASRRVQESRIDSHYSMEYRRPLFPTGPLYLKCRVAA